jgi:ABC-type uncharacterized transport system substrate-binding protein
MKRREFIMVLGGAAATWPLTASAQEPRRVIGVLGSAAYGVYPGDPEALLIQGLKDTGFIEGKNISTEWRYAEGQYNRLPSLAGELVSRGVAVIVTFDVPASSAAKAATNTIPIVFAIGADPVKTGLVDSLSRPSGNLMGVFNLVSAVGPKCLELLHELFPSTSTFALLVNPNNPNVVHASETEAAAKAIGRRLEVLTATSNDDLETAFTTMVKRQAGALIVMADPLFIAQRELLVALAARYAAPTIYPHRDFPEKGSLMSYGPDIVELVPRAATYVRNILTGAKPADLPVQQSFKLELVINLKTAKALGLTIPPTLLARTDETIE